MSEWNDFEVISEVLRSIILLFFSIQIHEYLSPADFRDELMFAAVCEGCLCEAGLPVMATRWCLYLCVKRLQKVKERLVYL